MKRFSLNKNLHQWQMKYTQRAKCAVSLCHRMWKESYSHVIDTAFPFIPAKLFLKGRSSFSRFQ